MLNLPYPRKESVFRKNLSPKFITARCYHRYRKLESGCLNRPVPTSFPRVRGQQQHDYFGPDRQGIQLTQKRAPPDSPHDDCGSPGRGDNGRVGRRCIGCSMVNHQPTKQDLSARARSSRKSLAMIDLRGRRPELIGTGLQGSSKNGRS